MEKKTVITLLVQTPNSDSSKVEFAKWQSNNPYEPKYDVSLSFEKFSNIVKTII
jgi:hypothetical protein